MDFLASLSMIKPKMKTKKEKIKGTKKQKKKEADEAIARARAWALNRRNARETKRKEESRKEENVQKNTKMVKYEGEGENKKKELVKIQQLQHILQKEEQLLVETKIKIDLIKKELSRFIN
jgi:hypothetical protein